jgi:YVTN family beta-propeller protein
VTNKIYVANSYSNNVTVIDGATNLTTTVGTGTDPRAVAVDPVSNEIYVANYGSNNVTVIDGATNLTTTVGTGTNPAAVAVNPVTNKIYAANGGSANVAVIDGATNSITTVGVGTIPDAVAANPVTNKIYVVNSNGGTRGSVGNVTVIDAATHSTATVAAGSFPFAVDVNPVTNKIYVTNAFSNNVTVIDGATNSTTTVTDPNASDPTGVDVNQVTNKIYIANENSANVTVIDGATNTTTTVAAGSFPFAVAVNPVTNKIYVTNCGSECGGSGSGNGNITVIDGATNSTTTVTDPNATAPNAVAVNPVTNKIYVGNFESENVTVIDGATNSTTTVGTGACCNWAVTVNPVTNKIYLRNPYNVTVIDGATNLTTTVATGANPEAVAVNPVTNKIYVANEGSHANLSNVTVIDGATNSTTTVTDPNAVEPAAVVVNPVTNQIYVANSGSNNVTVITEELVEPIPLATAIAPLTDNQTTSPTPTFDFTATSSFSPTAPTPQAVWYQLDTWQGPWLPASGTTPNFTGATPSLSLGTHILYAFATDGQDANSTGMEQQLIGSMAAYLFDVVPPANTTTALTSSLNPSTYGQSVTFTATVTVTPPGSGTPTGTVTFYDGTTALGSVALASNGQAVYATSALTVGSHSITATYSGDTSFLGSTSPVLTQVVYPLTSVTLSPAALSFGDEALNDTSAAKTVTLTNTGSATLYIGNIAASANFAVSANACGATLAAGAKCTVKVTFTPTVLGGLTGTLTFTDSASNSPQTVALSGAGIEPATLTPATATYASQAEGTTSAAKTFTLTNDQPVALNNIVISTTGDFAVSATTCTTSLAAKQKCTISVTFTPAATGTLTGQLSVSDSASNNPQTSNLTGKGVVPAALTPASATYAAQKVGTTSGVKVFTLTNNQPMELDGIMPSATGDFTVSATTCTGSLAAKKKCTISVKFTPSATGTRTGQLNVSDSANNSPQTSSLTGTGK